MPLSDILVAALSRPAGRVVDVPVRAIVAEILADHGYASPAEVAALREEISALRGKVQTLGGRLDALEAGMGAVRAEAEAMRAALEQAHAAARSAEARAGQALAEAQARAVAPPVATPEPAAPAPAHAAAESADACKVTDCPNTAYAQGFCRTHHHLWRAGRLPGFVSPEGLLELEGRAARVAADLAGQPYKISDKDGRLRVAGRFAAATALG